jgi:hypothetical protein
MNTRTMTAAVQRAKMLTIMAVLVIGGLAPVRPARADINEQVAQLDLGKATLKDVLRIFGEPQSYSWEGKTLTRDSLPRIYMLAYPNDFSVLMNGGRVGELRFGGPGAGYAYRGKLRVGSSLEEALAVVGQPASTVEGGHVGGQDGVLYKDVDGKKGDCYYSRADQHVRLFFQDYKVVGLCLMGRQQRGDLDAGGKLAKLSEQPAGPVTFPKIDRRPAPCDFERGSLEAAPKYDPKNSDAFQVDLRSYDLSRLDLREAAVALTHANFDDRTVWPAPERLPSGFDRQRMVELAKNPGLRVHSLHAQGITGRGVGIAIIDNPLLTDHQEYAERLRLYEEDNVPSETEAHMHGPAVASIAVGKTIGVAPEADLYYIGRWAFDTEGAAGGRPSATSKYEAEAIQRILQINEQLPADRKIRVISISFGWQFGQRGFAEATKAAQEAKAAGLLVISSSVEMTHGFKFHGLGRDLLSSADDFASYRPARWGQDMYANHDRLLVPMDARVTASPTGKNEYAFYGEGGWSWAIPYIAGAYALAAQVDPKITPERFWALAMKTGRTVRVSHESRSLDLGPILDPVQLIEALRRGDLSDKAAVAAELAKYSASSRGSDDRVSEDFAARIARLDFDRASRRDVIEQLGQPASHVLGQEVLDPNNLPSRYVMLYPAGVQVIMSADRVRAIVVSLPGYLWRNKIEVGTPIQDVFKVLGSPNKTVENAPSAELAKAQQEDGIFYKDIDGVGGTCLYHILPSQGVSLYFTDNRVRQMTLIAKGGN